jgi:hypothetical protein
MRSTVDFRLRLAAGLGLTGNPVRGIVVGFKLFTITDKGAAVIVACSGVRS